MLSNFKLRKDDAVIEDQENKGGGGGRSLCMAKCRIQHLSVKFSILTPHIVAKGYFPLIYIPIDDTRLL